MTELDQVQEAPTFNSETAQELAQGAVAFSAAITNSTRQQLAQRTAKKRNSTGWRRLVDPHTPEGDFTVAELEFMFAMQEYKKSSCRMFPTWSEVLEVLRSLGYENVQSQSH
jgi:hypothetical protein